MDAGSVDSRHVTHIQNIYLDIGIAAHEHSLETVHHAEEERSGYGINENPFRQIVLIDKTFVKITHDITLIRRIKSREAKRTPTYTATVKSTRTVSKNVKSMMDQSDLGPRKIFLIALISSMP